MTLGVYLRLLIESFQIMLLASLTETKKFDTTDSSHTFSLIYAFLVILLSVTLMLLMLIEWLRSRNPITFNKQAYFKTFFTGTKMTWWSRSFLLLNHLRKTGLLWIVIYFDSDKSLNIGCFVSAQAIYLIILLFLRPMETTKDNLIEILNEITFTILSSGLIFLNDENDWNNKSEDFYYYTLIGNTIIVASIIWSKFKLNHS